MVPDRHAIGDAAGGNGPAKEPPQAVCGPVTETGKASLDEQLMYFVQRAEHTTQDYRDDEYAPFPFDAQTIEKSGAPKKAHQRINHEMGGLVPNTETDLSDDMAWDLGENENESVIQNAHDKPSLCA